MSNDKLQEGLKFDEGKIAWDLIPWEAVEELAYIYSVGAAKYEPRNWERGYRWGRSYAAAFRHMNEWWNRREDYDPDCGAHHLAQAAWNILALLHFDLHKEDYAHFDDRPKYNSRPEFCGKRLGSFIDRVQKAWAAARKAFSKEE